MKKLGILGPLFAGAAAGTVNGLLGAGGGMVLVPLLVFLTDLEEAEIFPASVTIILPVCLTSLAVTAFHASLPWATAMPFLFGSVIGGILAAVFGKKIPVLWLHRVLGIFILWGGVRYLC